jgi:hypothetical protein
MKFPHLFLLSRIHILACRIAGNNYVYFITSGAAWSYIRTYINRPHASCFEGQGNFCLGIKGNKESSTLALTRLV